MIKNAIDNLYRNDDKLEDHLHPNINKSKQPYQKKSVYVAPITTDLKEKSSFPISKQLTSYRTKLQAKVTILGTDRATFACAVTMAIRRYVSEIVIYDPFFNRQMKTCFHDLACAFQICSISRSVKLVYTSDIAYTSRSDLILVTEMHDNNTRTKQYNKKSSFSLKQKAKEFIDRLHSASPYDYNSLVVKSLAGNRCHVGQVCGLGSNIYSHRLRYAMSELFGTSSTNIIGFALENTTQLIEPYWPSITINGLSIESELNNNKEVKEQDVSQSISDDTTQEKHHMMTIKDNNTVRLHKYLTEALPSTNLNKNVKQKLDKRNVSLSDMNNKTSIRIRQWLQSIMNNHEITKQVQYRHEGNRSISNNAVNISQSIQDQLAKQLNGWHCLQRLYHHPCDYTLGMNLSQVIRSIISNSQEIFLLSTCMQPFLKHQSTTQLEHDNLFASVPVHIRRYGIHAILHFKSQIELYNQVQKILKRNQIFCNIIN